MRTLKLGSRMSFIFTLLVICLFFVSSCNQDDLIEHTEDSVAVLKEKNTEAKESEIPAAFYFNKEEYTKAIRQASSLTEGGNTDRVYPDADLLSMLADIILNENNEDDFLVGLIEQYGLPVWNESSYRGSEINESYYISLPWTKVDTSTGRDTLTAVLQLLMHDETYSLRMFPKDMANSFMALQNQENNEHMYVVMALNDLLFYEEVFEGTFNQGVFDWFENHGYTGDQNEANVRVENCYAHLIKECWPCIRAFSASDECCIVIEIILICINSSQGGHHTTTTNGGGLTGVDGFFKVTNNGPGQNNNNNNNEEDDRCSHEAKSEYLNNWLVLNRKSPSDFDKYYTCAKCSGDNPNKPPVFSIDRICRRKADLYELLAPLELSSEDLECLMTDLPAAEEVVELMASVISNPCDASTSESEILGDAIKESCSSNGDISISEFYEALATEDKIYNYLSSPKAICIWNKLTEGHNPLFCSTYGNFIGSEKHSMGITDEFPTPGACGKTVHNKTTDVITVYISPTCLSENTTIEMAKTIMHEAIHAELYRIVIAIQNFEDTSPEDYATVWEAYRSDKGWQHNFMADHYINALGESLAIFDDYRYSIDHYNALAWKGLDIDPNNGHPMSVAWSNKSAAEKATILSLQEELIQNSVKTCP